MHEVAYLCLKVSPHQVPAATLQCQEAYSQLDRSTQSEVLRQQSLPLEQLLRLSLPCPCL